MRALEELNIPEGCLEQALEELDALLRGWADRHHQTGGVPFAVQMVCGVQ